MIDPSAFPSLPGTYVLILECIAPQQVQVGALGNLPLQPGWYLYVGSAFGPGGLKGRLAHHLTGNRPQHWHVDALKPVTFTKAVWFTDDSRHLEHNWASACLAMPGIMIPMKGFGSSDCRCPAHLFRATAYPTLSVFYEAVKKAGLAHIEIRCIEMKTTTKENQ